MTSTKLFTTRAGSAGHSVGENRGGAFRHVLVGVDGTASGRDAIALARVLSGADGRLTLAHVSVSQVPVYRNFPATPAGKRSRTLLRRERDATGVTAQLTGMFAPTVGHGLRQLAVDCDADLLVVGDDARVAASGATCAVAVAPHGYRESPPAIDTIGVAYEDTDEARAALAIARSLAARDGRRLSAITVVSPASIPLGGWLGRARAWQDHTDTLVQPTTERLRALDGVDESRVAVGDVGDELVAFGDEVELLVVGSRGHGPVRRLILGSTSRQLTREARCPLLVVPPAPTARRGRSCIA